MPCSSPKLCLHDTALQFIRASSLLTSAAGVALIILACQVIFPLPSATPNLLIHLWFPLSISILGLLLAVLGLAASCSSTAALFLNGSYLFLIPLEQALVALYIWDYAELKHWASGDETGGFKACLHWIGANAKLAAVLLATLTVLQVSSLVLTVTVVCCCKPKKRNSIKHRWVGTFFFIYCCSCILFFIFIAKTKRSQKQNPAQYIT